VSWKADLLEKFQENLRKFTFLGKINLYAIGKI